jgi:hypothetical protein
MRMVENLENKDKDKEKMTSVISSARDNHW